METLNDREELFQKIGSYLDWFIMWTAMNLIAM